MRAIRPERLGLLLCLLVASPAVQADGHEYACKVAVRELGDFAGAKVTRNEEAFALDRKTYRGCVIKIEGESPCLDSATGPWWGLYPFIGLMGGWTAHHDGWKVVEEKVDFWNSLFYQVARGNAFCLVQSTWHDDKYPARQCEGDSPGGKTLRIVAKCALAR